MKQNRQRSHVIQIDIDDLITKAEAARMCGTNRAAITALIQRKRLRVFPVGGREFVSRTEVENFKDRRKEKRAA